MLALLTISQWAVSGTAVADVAEIVGLVDELVHSPHLEKLPDLDAPVQPVPPHVFAAEGAEDGIRVLWAPRQVGELHRVEVWRSVDNGTFEHLDTIGSERSPYHDADVALLTNHSYKMRALARDGSASAFTEPVTAQSCPADYVYCYSSLREDPLTLVPYVFRDPVFDEVPKVPSLEDPLPPLPDGRVTWECSDGAHWCWDVNPNGDATVESGPEPHSDGVWCHQAVRRDVVVDPAPLMPCVGAAIARDDATCRSRTQCMVVALHGDAACEHTCVAAISPYGDATCRTAGDWRASLGHSVRGVAVPCAAVAGAGSASCEEESWAYLHIIHGHGIGSFPCLAMSGLGAASCQGGPHTTGIDGVGGAAPCIAGSVGRSASCASGEGGEWMWSFEHNACVAIAGAGDARCDAPGDPCVAASGFREADGECQECVVVGLDDAHAECTGPPDNLPRPCVAVSGWRDASCSRSTASPERSECVALAPLGKSSCNGEPCGLDGPTVLDEVRCASLALPCRTPTTGAAGVGHRDTSRCNPDRQGVGNSRVAYYNYHDCEERTGWGPVGYHESREVHVLGGAYVQPRTCSRMPAWGVACI